ncbi:amidohydrolase [Phocea massiliensis]|uniref:amidohydrolase n=1 Tax=Merdimmobilis hominis TaxID=2897707 RepID=UPI001E652F52|nr:amidohydrolase [Merdimmobilis hominis]MCD4837146.1 amidohydrolase [Merdimmobilis hominis]
MDKQALKQAVCAAIDQHREKIFEIGEAIRVNPELGYKEFKTAQRVKEVFEEMGLPYQEKVALTGLIAQMKGRSPGVKMAVMGELDAVVCPGHPQADPVTGAAHSCGHHAQVAAMLGMAMGLQSGGAMEYLDGDLLLMAVPAEEAVEIEWRQSLIDQGKIRYIGGKQNMIKDGYFDDIDLAMMVHGTTGDKIEMADTSTGFVVKFVRYLGKEAHAGGAPHLGINALNAAQIGLAAINANRETFQDKDTIRVHPIITKGGDLVNVVPADVRIETYIRGKTMEGVLDASKKVNRALKAGADAVGAQVVIQEIPGYMPRMNEKRMNQLFEANVTPLVGSDHVVNNGHTTGSSDFGDIMHLMPGIHPYIGGAVGRGHSSDYQIVDPEMFYIVPAKAMAMTVIDLLWDGAAEAKAIVESYQPVYKNKEEYLAAWEELMKG